MSLNLRPYRVRPGGESHAIPNAADQKRYALIMQRLRMSYPAHRSRLRYDTPFQLLIAAILLAQSSEDEVNSATPVLFAQYPTPAALAAAGRPALQDILKPIGFARQKTKYVTLTSQIIAREYDGAIPGDLLTLTKLPGVARKTANFIMGELHGIVEGIQVDMDVRRVAHRLDLSRAKSAEAIENQLISLAPRSDWLDLPRLVNQHAAIVCTIHNPACGHCPLHTLCPTAASGSTLHP